MIKLYKVPAGDQSCHGGKQVRPLPIGDQPGEWVEYPGDLAPCYHLTCQPAVWYDRSGLSVYEAESEGGTEDCGDGKVVCRRVRLVKKLTAAESAAVAVYTFGRHEVKTGAAAASGSATVQTYSDRNNVELHFLAVQIDRSKSDAVVVRHSPDTAVVLESLTPARATG